MPTKKVNAQLIKKLNEVRILNLVRYEGPISRIELAKKTGISKVAVSEIIRRLDDAGYILEIGKGTSTKRGGKRPTMIKINPENGYVFGIEIHLKKATIALADLESKIICRDVVAYSKDTSAEKGMALIFDAMDRLLEKCTIESSQLVSIGIGLPGLSDYTDEQAFFSDTLKGFGHKLLGEKFARKYQVSVTIENDVNAMTVGEQLLGAGRNERNFVYIWIGEGLGAGIVVDDHLIRGHYGSAGELGYLELGYMLADRSRLPNLYTSNQEFFGNVMSEEHLTETLQLKLQWKTGEDKEKISNMSLAEIIDEYSTKYPIVHEVLDEYAHLLSIICTVLLKTIDPNLIIIGGSIIENSEYLLVKTRQLVKQRMINIPFRPTDIIQGELKEDACIKGAISLALQTIFEPVLRQSKGSKKIYSPEEE
ncbi:MAG: ROK family protein [Candidatus Marinimicrobia bacterium]|nr:ROK family protein [Candidatus Neomarinimicrobiota bacterium]